MAPAAFVAAQEPVCNPCVDGPEMFEHRPTQTPRDPRAFLAPNLQTALVGGEKIPLRFRIANRPRPQPELDDGVSGGFFEPLASAARAGNDAAAHQLFEALRNCAPYPKTRAELDAAVARGRQWFEQTGGFTGDETLDWDEANRNLQRLYMRCDSVTQEMSATAIELLRESVGRGYDDNRLLYAGAIHDTDPQEAHAQLEAAWQKGDIAALQMLGGDSLPHQIAALTVEIAQFDGRSAPGLMQATAQARERLAALEAKTSPSEFRAASEEAARILHNPNCCEF